MTLLMWAMFISGLMLVGATPWGLVPILSPIGFLLGGGR